MNFESSYRGTLKVTALIILLGTLLLIDPLEIRASELTRRESDLWKSVYAQVNPGEEIIWPKGGPRVWARENADAVDSIIATIIRGVDEIPWTHGLIGARIVIGAQTHDALFERLNFETNKAAEGIERLPEEECAVLAGVLKLLAARGDSRPVGIANSLLRDSNCSSPSTEQIIVALQQIGNEQTLDLLQELPLRQRHSHIDRLCLLTEKLIDARMDNRDYFADAPAELRGVTAAWVAALENRDKDAFLKAMAHGAQVGVSGHDFLVELLRSPELPPMLAALKTLAGRETFEIDRQKLEATLIVNDQYKFGYVLESDGWKAVGPMRFNP